MKIDKVDICIVTKNPTKANYIIRKLKNASFVNNIIIETSKPLGFARFNAIQKVSTKWFAFIDDDILIPDIEAWFSILTSYIASDVGAVEGIVLIKGLGDQWDKAINSLSPRKPVEVPRSKWGRGYTHNTLIKTDLVKDWKPSSIKLEVLEDLELTKHIQAKGYKWLRVPVKAYHIKNWKIVAKNSLWYGKTLKYCNIFTSKEKVIRVISIVLFMIRCLFDFSLKMNLRTRFFSVYQKLFIILGLIS